MIDLERDLIYRVVIESFSFLFLVNGDCFDPEVPKDGSRSSPEKHQFKTGAVIHYYCKANYTLVGSPKVLCLASGNWDTKPPSCIGVYAIRILLF